MKRLRDLLEQDGSAFKIVASHNNKIECVTKSVNQLLKSVVIDQKEQVITVRAITRLPPLLSADLSIFIMRGQISCQNSFVRTALYRVLSTRQLVDEMFQNDVIRSIVMEVKNKNEIRVQFRLQERLTDEEQYWKTVVEYLLEWQEILKDLMKILHEESSLSFMTPTDQEMSPNVMMSTAGAISRDRTVNKTTVPRIMTLVAMRSEQYFISSRSFQVKPITGAFTSITWTWPTEEFNESCSMPLKVTAFGTLRAIDDSPPHETRIELASDDELSISGTDDHIIKELKEKWSSLMKITSLHHFEGSIIVKKDGKRNVTVEMIHGACQHDVEVAYGVLQDIGWTIEMAYYSDRLLAKK